MAELSESETYVIVKARVWYDPKSDSVHFTSDDKDLRTGVHVTAKKGSVMDANLRAALAHHGLPTQRG